MDVSGWGAFVARRPRAGWPGDLGGSKLNQRGAARDRGSSKRGREGRQGVVEK
ncbi:MAG: hypothetical protein MI923_12905 [Phycisphaerales bacterium]|nr:hypothetical protein [Phycisphaerales bacterium]